MLEATPVKPPALPDADQALCGAVIGPPGAAQRRAVAKAITLLESTRPDHRLRADALLNALLGRSGGALRLGISGVPGVGKSTFIEALGLYLIARGHRVAVLAVDPSSASAAARSWVTRPAWSACRWTSGPTSGPAPPAARGSSREYHSIGCC